MIYRCQTKKAVFFKKKSSRKNGKTKTERNLDFPLLFLFVVRIIQRLPERILQQLQLLRQQLRQLQRLLQLLRGVRG